MKDKKGSKLKELRESVAEDIRRSELTKTAKWVEDNDEYYTNYPNEIIYAHTLLKAMKAVAEDLEEKS